MLLNSWLPQVLRAAGIQVVETPAWTSRTHGPLAEMIAVCWHHDASPPGDSPGALQWMISNWNTASANVWIDRYGTWYLVGCGFAYHAGKVGPGFPASWDCIGIETDHTTGEDWPTALLSSLRRGTAAIFNARNRAVDSLYFHKQIAVPLGRKQDPDGLEIVGERATVAVLMKRGTATPLPQLPQIPNPAKDWFDMADKADLAEVVTTIVQAQIAPLVDFAVRMGGQLNTLRDITNPAGPVYLVGPGTFAHIPDDETYQNGLRAGIWSAALDSNTRQVDLARLGAQLSGVIEERV